MGRLIYSAITSLDGYVADEEGRFDWSAPDEEVHAFVNDQQRAVGTYLYGRRVYEVMVAWDTMQLVPDQSPAVRDYTAIWRAADKIVFSRTISTPASARTRIERHFDPDDVRALKASSDSDLSIGGPHLAAEAFRGGLIDEIQLLVSPMVVGGGIAALPYGLRQPLELTGTRRFDNGVVYVQYAVC